MKSKTFKISILLAVFLLAAPAYAGSGHLATLQDQARSSRESFLRLQREPVAPATDNATTTDARLRSLDDKVAEIREQAILVNYQRIIAKLSVYTSYLSGANERLEEKLQEKQTAGSDISVSLSYAQSARTSLETASSTIALAKASSTEIFLSTDPSAELVIMKERLALTSGLLQQAREAIVAGINALKTEAK